MPNFEDEEGRALTDIIPINGFHATDVACFCGCGAAARINKAVDGALVRFASNYCYVRFQADHARG